MKIINGLSVSARILIMVQISVLVKFFGNSFSATSVFIKNRYLLIIIFILISYVLIYFVNILSWYIESGLFFSLLGKVTKLWNISLFFRLQ